MAKRLRLAQQLRQLGDVHGNPSRLILAEQLGGRASAGLILEIDIGKLLSVAVADNEAGGLLFSGPRWRETAGGHGLLSELGGTLDEIRGCPQNIGSMGDAHEDS